jgi:hypothetical protein
MRHAAVGTCRIVTQPTVDMCTPAGAGQASPEACPASCLDPRTRTVMLEALLADRDLSHLADAGQHCMQGTESSG